jgi:hypothetical protein
VLQDKQIEVRKFGELYVPDPAMSITPDAHSDVSESPNMQVLETRQRMANISVEKKSITSTFLLERQSLAPGSPPTASSPHHPDHTPAFADRVESGAPPTHNHNPAPSNLISRFKHKARDEGREAISPSSPNCSAAPSAFRNEAEMTIAQLTHDLTSVNTM